MELFDRYVHQVGKRLPKSKRNDVQNELRSLLDDALEERIGGATGETDTTEAQVAVLKEFGPPAEMADQYQPRPHYLIGPRTYPLYRVVLGAIALAAVVAAVVVTLLSTVSSEVGLNDVPQLIARGLALLWNIFISGVGTVTLIFAALERLVPDLRLDTRDASEKADWDPRDLPKIEEDEPKVGSLIAEVVVTALLIAIFAGWGERINIAAYYRDGWHTMPGLLAPAFFNLYLPVLTVRWCLTIILDLVVLRKGRWQMGTRVFGLIVKTLDLGILVWMVTGPAIIDDAAWLAMLGGVEMPFKLSNMIRLALGLGALGSLVEIVKTVLRLAGISKVSQITPAGD